MLRTYTAAAEGTDGPAIALAGDAFHEAPYYAEQHALLPGRWGYHKVAKAQLAARSAAAPLSDFIQDVPFCPFVRGHSESFSAGLDSLINTSAICASCRSGCGLQIS